MKTILFCLFVSALAYTYAMPADTASGSSGDSSAASSAAGAASSAPAAAASAAQGAATGASSTASSGLTGMVDMGANMFKTGLTTSQSMFSKFMPSFGRR